MENTTVNSKLLFLSNIPSSWLQEILIICIIVPMGTIGTVLNLICLNIFLKKSIRKIALFKYLIILSVVNSIIAFSQIFFFYFSFNIFYDLALSLFGRIFISIGINDIIFFFFFLSNLIEILINIERALYFREGFQKFKKISPFFICFLILILSLIIYTPNFLSIKLVPEDQIYILYTIVIPSDFALSKLGKIIVIISYILEGPVVFILLIVTNIIALISYKRFNQRKELIERANNIEMMADGEIKKKKKIEKKDRKLLMMTTYLSLVSIVTSLLQFTTQFSYTTQLTSLNQKTLGWFLFASIFSIALKQFTSIIVYFNYETFRNKFKGLIIKFLKLKKY